jgi:hypothetical protein
MARAKKKSIGQILKLKEKGPQSENAEVSWCRSTAISASFSPREDEKSVWQGMNTNPRQSHKSV